ncbi:MAG TPA: PQQ-binding-like beta-propeller repeat protein [Planctomycetaceae bacterium]|nr:PQQ-binding-like beta-propeller repeat protein [Planctomycetaceae bacterium]
MATHRFRMIAVLCFTVALGSSVAAAGDWTRFRGPNGSAVSDDRETPVNWSATENIIWRTLLPGPGTSSPIVTGGKVFLTCYAGYGLDQKNPGSPENLERILVCLDERDGKILWQQAVKGVGSEDRYSGFINLHGYASSTPATDGERVYVLFGKAGVVAFDLEGKQLWQKSVGTGSAPMGWGSAASPIVYKNLVIVNAAAESKTIFAFDGKTGQEVWKSPADSLASCWGTPVLVDVAGGKQELVIAVPFEIWGFDPDSGEFLWFSEGVKTNAACASLVSRDGIVYSVAGGPGGGGAAAVRAGGRDDVTKTHVLWNKSASTYVASPVLVGDYLFWVSDQGIAHCMSRENGEIVYKQRLAGSGTVYSSLVAAGDKLYSVTRDKGTFVLAARPEFEQLAQNQLDSDAGVCNAGPAVSNGRLLLRSNKYLYSIGGGK